MAPYASLQSGQAKPVFCVGAWLVDANTTSSCRARGGSPFHNEHSGLSVDRVNPVVSTRRAKQTSVGGLWQLTAQSAPKSSPVSRSVLSEIRLHTFYKVGRARIEAENRRECSRSPFAQNTFTALEQIHETLPLMGWSEQRASATLNSL